MKIAVIGAGVSGLSCAIRLKASGHEVSLFDKGRRPGGRMSTRRVELDGRTLRFDHGAQYFTARDPAFMAQVAAWERAGLVARWPAAGEDAWVGTPGMSAPVAAMAGAHHVASGTRIEAIAKAAAGWRLAGDPAEARCFDAVAIATPAEQAAPLLDPHHADFAGLAAASRSTPCWTLMAAFAEPTGLSGGPHRKAGAIGWAARDGDKPGRDGAETWVVQASAEWSLLHLEEPPAQAAAALLAAFQSELSFEAPTPIHLSAHRWRYAKSAPETPRGALWSPTHGLGVCGDWLLAPRVESAWLSGARLAAAIG